MAEERRNKHRADRLARPRWWLYLTVPLGTFLLCFLIVEAGFRIIESRSVPEGELWAEYDPDLGYRLNPSHPDINSYGMRDRPVPGPDGRFRVLVLGDSVAYYGDNVDDTFVAYMGATLREDPELAETVVLNAGVKGYTNYQELLWLRKYGLNLEPDLVGIAFVFNDLHRFLHAFRIEDGKIVGQSYDFTEEAIGTVQNPLYHLARKSHFLVWLRRRFSDVLSTIELSTLASQTAFTFDVRPDFDTAWQDEPWEAIEAQLGQMQDLGRRHGFRIFVVAFPFGQQYRADYLERDREYVMKPQRRLGAIVRSLGIPYLDLYPMIEPQIDLLSDDIHLSDSGRRKVGGIIARFLKSERLVPLSAQ